jgi:hypothetical protein
VGAWTPPREQLDPAPRGSGSDAKDGQGCCAPSAPFVLDAVWGPLPRLSCLGPCFRPKEPLSGFCILRAAALLGRKRKTG